MLISPSFTVKRTIKSVVAGVEATPERATPEPQSLAWYPVPENDVPQGRPFTSAENAGHSQTSHV